MSVPVETITTPDIFHLEKLLQSMGFERELSTSGKFRIYTVGKSDDGNLIDVVVPAVGSNEWERKHYSETAANIMDAMGLIKWARPDARGWYLCADILPPVDQKQTYYDCSMQVLIRQANGWYHMGRLTKMTNWLHWATGNSGTIELSEVTHWKVVESPMSV